ncbi:uncharacterized protein LOC111273884 isoform X2 [Varroa jacobsoni]|uniref:Protein quiver n=1 Tax=Varroa destructor TaxID=109461 RepID=A0A7M7KL72_VARDE|nr:uncharacterized protein LOC111253450 [Varroa destructor]XP_022711646.1 uncharacterized protein LOC111273884 isoform X2 [Varroa jacobsoni]
MMTYRINVGLAVMAVVLCATIGCSYATQCYLCSWSQKEEALGVNHTAKCRDEFFRPDKISATHCDYGCELHIFKDLNGIIESVRRTCGKEPKSRMDISSGCSATRMRQGTTKICRCQTDYCNSSRGTVIASLTLTFVGVLIAAMFFLWRC